MSKVVLVRHGQANAGAGSEEEYDRLSDLGRQQARWLGEYMATTDHGMQRIVAGTLNRQRDTARELAGLLGLSVDEDPRLREMNYFELARSAKETHDIDLPNGRESFIEHFPLVMEAWEQGSISCSTETYAQFSDRVLSALSDAEETDGTMLVTSGGVIGVAIRHILGLDTHSFAHVLLQINNASLHRYTLEFGGRRLNTFNALPHLDPPERAHARTFI